jgi:N-acetyl-1-D-myo-inositol-2-amino-2-deoxy-alpha-D-glucopyranoside deacetylase
VTCTLGEGGEVIPPELAELAADRTDTLGEHRIGELTSAMRELGVADLRFLGGPGRYRDSGMMGVPDNDRPDCFWQADVAEAAGHLVEVIREVRPQVLVTYDEHGGYGHPDHIQAHRVARRAVTVAADQAARVPGEPLAVAKFYVTAMPRSVAAADGGRFWVPDEQVTTEIDGDAFLPAKTAAMRAHATQIAVDSGSFALADGAWQRIGRREYYTLLAGPAPDGPEQDLFAGL